MFHRREKSVSTSTRSFEKRDDNSPTGVVDAASTFFAGDNDEFSSKDTPSPLLGATAYVSSGRYEGLSGKILIVEARGWWIIDNPQISKKVRSNLCRLVDDGNANMDEIREWYVGRGLGERMPLIVKPGQEEEEDSVLGAEVEDSVSGMDIEEESDSRGRKGGVAVYDEMDSTSIATVGDGSHAPLAESIETRQTRNTSSNTRDISEQANAKNNDAGEGGSCEGTTLGTTCGASDPFRSSKLISLPGMSLRKRKALPLDDEAKEEEDGPDHCIPGEHIPIRVKGVYPKGPGKWVSARRNEYGMTSLLFEHSLILLAAFACINNRWQRRGLNSTNTRAKNAIL